VRCTLRRLGPRRWPSAHEAGSVTIVTAAVMALAVVVTMGAADVGKALVARAHAQQAADAAALAAAQEQALATGLEPAAVAADLAARNGATLVACSCPTGATEATVRVSVDVGPFLLVPGTRTAEATARAVIGAQP
jgi:secretion/DNA translocation related TadE-like protein